MLRPFVEKLMSIRCCCEQDAAAYRTVLYPNHHSEAPAQERGRDHCKLGRGAMRGHRRAVRHHEAHVRGQIHLGSDAPLRLLSVFFGQLCGMNDAG